MPTYELVLLLKKLPVADLKSAIKKTALSLFESGAVLRKIENLGFRKLPYRIKGNDGIYKEANFFVYTFDSGLNQISGVTDSLKRDMNVVRQRIFFTEDKLDVEEKKSDCDIHLDLLNVPERPHVQLMIKLSKQKERKPFHYGGGRDFDPLAK